MQRQQRALRKDGSMNLLKEQMQDITNQDTAIQGNQPDSSVVIEPENTQEIFKVKRRNCSITIHLDTSIEPYLEEEE